ncbi:M20/M25/M40 family metallo-hydrolase [Flavobacteriaceae bacterium]|uniref:M20/M25/M40 family metallo-hydrolase n=1 Tax=Candidatus Arcticimaribacter forsetii TaxID=2820661 RepID=UPI0020775E6D|nr:M20/M25/M40 family metallo-hydrolase [Candidatus Arcticimaribacter forsetii]MDA8699462.1 M20/M25/M40 family metallo-hydrolase [Flavobacteriaceae bacterium]MDB4674774.1 M20/M25/M40 family metallo-hydrolase [Flavobacteriaceae bacterium]MDB4717075.1 M20/M25/M40 family metallo-hydrolase [Flavobacteriaceae bacterium]
MKNMSILFLMMFGLAQAQSQSNPKVDDKLKSIYSTALLNGKSYSWLDHLSNQIGGRLSGSLNAQRAVDWGKAELDALGLDRVWLQPVMVPKWIRGTFEYAHIETSPGKTINVPICALGGSVATPLTGIKAEVIEVKGFEELNNLSRAEVEGKIVFFNRPMQADLINTFEAYSGCVDQRYSGAEQAANMGAVAVLVRSVNLRLDDYPHTGSMSYGLLPFKKRIPAAAISTNGAELLSSMISLNPNLRFYLKQNCKNLPDVQSYNVIGEIIGSEKPEEIMVVGGHLDSWDLGDGAHDDGAGVVQSMEVLRLFKEINYNPKRTLRVVLFMNEENGMRGATKYASVSKSKNENHVFALESDSGGFTPRGFSIDTSPEKLKTIQSWESYFEPYLIHLFVKGGSGADVGHLKTDANILAGLKPDSQRYFDYHHAENDTFDAINKRELELGSATMASLVFLVDYFSL